MENKTIFKSHTTALDADHARQFSLGLLRCQDNPGFLRLMSLVVFSINLQTSFSMIGCLLNLFVFHYVICFNSSLPFGFIMIYHYDDIFNQESKKVTIYGFDLTVHIPPGKGNNSYKYWVVCKFQNYVTAMAVICYANSVTKNESTNQPKQLLYCSFKICEMGGSYNNFNYVT